MFSPGDLEFCLCRFALEIKKVDGSEYPLNTIREIIIMIQMHLHENNVNWKLLDGECFGCLRNVIDNIMKERTANGLGVRQSSSIISLAQEDVMFQKGILGDDKPLVLLKTVIYMLGLHLALRGGVEHSRLRRPGFDCQITVEKDDKNRLRLVYREDQLQKTNQGGLNSKRNNKVVYVYEASDPRKCPIRIFVSTYHCYQQQKLAKKLYMRPKIKALPSLWYCDQPFGNNKVGNCVKEMCKEAGFEGKFTNHSLHATSASRMYQSLVPKQVIKELTGHKSDCVRTYKRTNDDIRKIASNTISGEKVSNCEQIENETGSSNEGVSVKSEENCSLNLTQDQSKRLSQSLSVCEMVKNVIKT